jgi:GNAT superfamily N-acetyltransferase
MVTIRQFRPADIPWADRLRAVAGWNQTSRDWAGYLAFAPEGCLVAEIAGEPVGTATTITYGQDLGWIGMVLVEPGHRRRGVGSRLLAAAMAHLQRRGVACIKLDATPMGREVYGPLGFVAEYGLARFQVDPPPRAGRATRTGLLPLRTVALAELARFDAGYFGTERAAVLEALRTRDPNLCFVVQEGAAIRGYLIARQGAAAVQVGPWVAETPGVAAELLSGLLAQAADRRVFADLLEPNVAGRELLAAHGFALQRPLTRMFLGQNHAPGRPEFIYSISGAEKG